MALEWNIEHIKDYKKLCWMNKGERMNPATEALIWAGNNLGYNQITEKNYKEIFIRMNMWEHGVQAYRTTSDGVIFFTLEDVKKHIGLATNWSPKTNAAFNKHLVKSMRTKSERVANVK